MCVYVCVCVCMCVRVCVHMGLRLWVRGTRCPTVRFVQGQLHVGPLRVLISGVPGVLRVSAGSEG